MSLFKIKDTVQANPIPASAPPTSLVPDTQEEAARLITDQDGFIVYMNAPFQELCDIPQNIEGINIQDIVSFDENLDVLHNGRHHVSVIHTQKQLSLEFNWVETSNGQEFMVASAEETTAGEKLLQYVAEKIEAKYQASASTQESSQIDHTPFFALSFDACCITQSDGYFDNINENFITLFGYDAQELSHKTLFDLLHPKSKSEFISALQNLKSDALYHQNTQTQSIQIEACCINKQGQQIWVEWSHQFIADKIYSAGRDVTPLKSYKDNLKRQQKKLSEAEAIGHIGQWEWRVGAENIIFSDQLYKIFGLKKKSDKPTIDNIDQMIHHHDSGRMMQVFQRAIIEQNDYDLDFRIQRADGEVRHIRCEGRCEIDSDDDVVALYGIMQDITEVSQRERDLVKAKESVERAYAAKTQFLANMSHELRTPLNAIIGFSEMMERQLLGPIGTEKYLEYIGGIRQSGEHLLDLISDILDMSKIEAGKYELHVEKFNIAKVIRMAAHMMEGRALDSEIKLNINIHNEEANIIADRRAVMQMVLNLLSNAVKFSDFGKHVNINLAEQNQKFVIRIEDQGIGIPANKLANIMLPFEQAETDYTRKYEGSGLGLAITKELTEIHGGQIDIQSQLDVGTTVTIQLPFEAKGKN